MPAKYEKLGIVFQYPDNWILDEEDALAGRQSVTVYSPGGAFWSVARHSGPADQETLAQAAVDALKEEYEELEVEAIRETLGGHELAGFDLSFFYLDLTNTAQIRTLQLGRATYTIFCQSEDREFARVQRVFEAMTTSLLQGLD